MLFKRIHRKALRRPQSAFTGSTGVLTLWSAQNGSQSLSGALQSELRHLWRSWIHRSASLTTRARMESRSANMGHTGSQDALRAFLWPFRCQHTLKRSERLQRPLRAFYELS